jgi:hypothetical protein
MFTFPGNYKSNILQPKKFVFAKQESGTNLEYIYISSHVMLGVGDNIFVQVIGSRVKVFLALTLTRLCLQWYGTTRSYSLSF